MKSVRHTVVYLIFLFTNFFSHASTEEKLGERTLKDPKLFLGMIIVDDDQLIPYFLHSIEKLQYDKSQIYLQMNVCNNTESVKNFLKDWISNHKQEYGKIAYIDNSSELKDKESDKDKNSIFAKVKDTFLAECKKYECSHCLILSSDIFIAPCTVRYLINKDKPIIAPLLRPIPEGSDPYRNFFAEVTESGYYKDSPDYMPIAVRNKIGTFKVPCIHAIYLIQSSQIDKLSFTKDFQTYEFIAFSNNARKNNIDQYICNEREFGSMLHLKAGTTAAERKAFKLVNADLEVTPSYLNKIFSSYYADDPTLETYIKNFDFDQYAIYRIQNKDLFYVDEVQDYIKSYYIKQGTCWEPEFIDLFKKYVRPGSIAIDIGGHIGTHTLQLSNLVGEQGTVYAFEPQLKIFTELAINMSLNNCKNVKLHHKAVGNEEKWIEMFIPKEAWTQGLSSHLVNEGHGTVCSASNNQNADRAKMVRLDDYKLDNVSFIKIDVEGFELDVIEGAIETIKHNKPTMVIEIFTNNETLRKIEFIEKLGYTNTKIGNADYLFTPIRDNNLL